MTTTTDTADRWRSNLQAHVAAQRMIREAIEELFGTVASLESEDAELLRGPEPHHTAEAFIAALQRVADRLLSIERERDGAQLAASVIEGISNELDIALTASQAEVERLRALVENANHYLDFVARWAWRDGKHLSDEERLSSIKYYPPIKAIYERALHQPQVEK